MQSHSFTKNLPSDIEAFFDGYWSTIKARGWSAIILHSWSTLPVNILSDVDYSIKGCTPHELLMLLHEYCRSQGWELVQVIEHDTNSLYCVCIQKGSDHQCIALDACWDYRRMGHDLLSSEQLHKSSRAVPGKSFDIPAPGSEAAYILCKAAAKAKDFMTVRPRVLELLRQDGESCIHCIRDFCGYSSMPDSADDSAILSIERWFNQADKFIKVRSGRRLGMREILLYCRRILKPAGLWISFDEPLDKEAFDQAIGPIRPLFRQTHLVDDEKKWSLFRTITSVIRASLVVDCGRLGHRITDAWIPHCNIPANTTTSEIRRYIIEHMSYRIKRRLKSGPAPTNEFKIDRKQN